MILTGKAKEDFLQWNEDNNEPLSTYAIKQGLIYGTVLNSIIIEWLDSVGVWDGVFYEVYIESTPTTEFKQILNKAIITANEIYNDRTK